jgi:hypothetical protein
MWSEGNAPGAMENRKATSSGWLDFENEPETGPREADLMISKVEAIDAIATPRSSDIKRRAPDVC